MTVARVVVVVPAGGTDHLFDYSVPGTFEDIIEKSTRVIVPFR